MLLDDFNRANEDPLSDGGRWIRYLTGEFSPKIVSNQCVPTASGTFSSVYWAPSAFNADQGIKMTIATLPGAGNYMRLYLRLKNPGGTSETGYMAQWQQGTALTIHKETANETFTQLATDSGATSFSAGDEFKFEVVGTTLTVYKNGVSVLSVTDATFSNSGAVRFGLKTGAIDDVSAYSLSTYQPSGARIVNGSDEFLFADDAAGFSESSPYSVFVWVKAAAGTGDLYSESHSSSSNPFLQLQRNASGKLVVAVRSDAGGTSQVNGVASALTAFDNTWHSVLYAQDGATPCNWQAYVDGAADSTAHGSYTPGTTTIDQLTLGFFRAQSNNSPFAGRIAHVAIWHRQLGANEAKALGGGLSPMRLNPAHYFPLFGGSDGPDPDLAAAGGRGMCIRRSSSAGDASGPPVELLRMLKQATLL